MTFRLREILKERSLTLRAFSELSGISQPNLSNYINGNVSPTLDMLNRISECLNIPITELFEKSEPVELYVKYEGDFYKLTANDFIDVIQLKQKNGQR